MESDYEGIIFPDDEHFVHPDSMTEAISEYCRRTRQVVPETVADFVRCIYRSLALRYKDVVKLLEEMCGFPIESLNVIGVHVDGCACEYTVVPAWNSDSRCMYSWMSLTGLPSIS